MFYNILYFIFKQYYEIEILHYTINCIILNQTEYIYIHNIHIYIYDSY